MMSCVVQDTHAFDSLKECCDGMSCLELCMLGAMRRLDSKGKSPFTMEVRINPITSTEVRINLDDTAIEAKVKIG